VVSATAMEGSSSPGDGSEATEEMEELAIEREGVGWIEAEVDATEVKER